ncbi:MAG: HRDC domain-containing protein [Pseudomonadota bacterium]
MHPVLFLGRRAGLRQVRRAIGRRDRPGRGRPAARPGAGDVQLRPTSREALRGISGIGPKKLELYGDDLLAAVAPGSSRRADR